MTDDDRRDGDHPAGLDRAVADVRRREAQWRREGERPLWANMALMGSLGWLIVLPALGGVFLGRWLDAMSGGGITFTGALLVVGLALGCRFAWQRMHRE